MSFKDLDQGNEKIIFESILTIFETSSIFWEAVGAVTKISLSLKSSHQNKFGLPKSVKHTVEKNP